MSRRHELYLGIILLAGTYVRFMMPGSLPGAVGYENRFVPSGWGRGLVQPNSDGVLPLGDHAKSIRVDEKNRIIVLRGRS